MQRKPKWPIEASAAARARGTVRTAPERPVVLDAPPGSGRARGSVGWLSPSPSPGGHPAHRADSRIRAAMAFTRRAGSPGGSNRPRDRWPDPEAPALDQHGRPSCSTSGKPRHGTGPRAQSRIAPVWARSQPAPAIHHSRRGWWMNFRPGLRGTGFKSHRKAGIHDPSRRYASPTGPAGIARAATNGGSRQGIAGC